MFYRRNVVLFDREIAIIEQAMQELGFSPRSGFSETLRFIIRDWARIKGYDQEHKAEAQLAGIASPPSSSGDGSGSVG